MKQLGYYFTWHFVYFVQSLHDHNVFLLGQLVELVLNIVALLHVLNEAFLPGLWLLAVSEAVYFFELLAFGSLELILAFLLRMVMDHFAGFA
jgi:hypothetical protein